MNKYANIISGASQGSQILRIRNFCQQPLWEQVWIGLLSPILEKKFGTPL